MSVTLNSWETGKWPVESGDEIASDLFEDLRKRIWLLRGFPGIGFNNIYDSVVRTHESWNLSGTWIKPYYDPPEPDEDVSSPGDHKIWFENPVTGIVKYYVNVDWAYAHSIHPDWGDEGRPKFAHPDEYTMFNIYAEGGGAWTNCPVNIDGTLNQHWKIATDPNLYHHWDYNSGRWFVQHYSGNSFYEYSTYTCKLPAHRWLPRQLDPYEQQFPYISPSNHICGCYRRFQGVEPKYDQITQYLAGQGISDSDGNFWSRGMGATPTPANGYGTWPTSYSIYYINNGHPWDERLSEVEIIQWFEVYRLGHIQKDLAAYQDHVCAVVEKQGVSRFVEEIGSAAINEWKFRYAEGLVSWNSGTEYSIDSKCTYSGLNYVSIADVNENHLPDEADSVWWKTDIYQPTYVGSHPVYIPLGDAAWRCNESPFEWCLRKLGRYDWWWDDSTPPLDNFQKNGGSLYERRFDEIDYSIESPPGNDFDTLWPRPDGCWRRTWKRTMGKVKSASGTEKVMWPSELGNPNTYFGITGGRMLVSSSVYASVHSSYQYLYEAFDETAMLEEVAELLEETYSGSTTYQNLLDQRHGPVQMKWDDSVEVPEYEIYADMMNDMRTVLTYLYRIDGTDLVDEEQRVVHYGAGFDFDVPHYDNDVDAIRSGHATADLPDASGEIIKSDEFVECGYHSGVRRFSSTDYRPEALGGPADEDQVVNDAYVRKFWLRLLISQPNTKESIQITTGQAITDNGDGTIRIPLVHDDWEVGDWVNIEGTSNYDCTTVIAEVPDTTHIDVPQEYVSPESGASGKTVSKFGRFQVPIENAILRMSYYGIGLGMSGENDSCLVGLPDGKFVNPDPTPYGESPIPLISYMNLDVPDPGAAAYIFDVPIGNDQWPAATDDDPAYDWLTGTSWLTSARFWRRVTYIKIDANFDRWIIFDVDWDKYVDNVPFGDVFELDCSNVIELE